MEETTRFITLTIGYAAEILAAVIIGIAIVKVSVGYVSILYLPKRNVSKEEIRVHFGSSVAVALELMLGADVLATAVAPNWDDIGKLAAIAIIRTALNYFLGKELKEIRTTGNE